MSTSERDRGFSLAQPGFELIQLDSGGILEAPSKMLVKHHDRTSSIAAWDCTAGGFNWHYSNDDAIVVISGEFFVTTKNGEARWPGQGDVEFFPAGISCTRRINDRLKGWYTPQGPAAPAGYWRASLATQTSHPKCRHPRSSSNAISRRLP